MDITIERIKQRLLEKDMSLRDLAKATGIPVATLSRYMSEGSDKIKLPKLELISKALNVEPPFLLGWDDTPPVPDVLNIIPIPEAVDVPLIGSIACGEPITAEENLEGYIKVPSFCKADFALKCKGDSMTGARIMDGDIVIIHQQPDVEDGEIAAVIIENEATLKRIYKMPGRLILRPENPNYQPMDFSGPDLNNIRIIGKAVYFISAVK